MEKNVGKRLEYYLADPPCQLAEVSVRWCCVPEYRRKCCRSL